MLPPAPPDQPDRGHKPPMKLAWTALGLTATGLGFAGIAIPGLPATPFFLAAAACFARCNPALLEWLLALPKVGPLIRDYRAGRGMPRVAKVATTVCMIVAGTISTTTLTHAWIRAAVLVLLTIGLTVVWFVVPTARTASLPPPKGPAPQPPAPPR